MIKVISGPADMLYYHVRWLILASDEFKWDRYPQSIVDYTKKYVYNQERSFYNWLRFENHAGLGIFLDKIILIENDINNVKEDKNLIVLNVDPKMSLRYYFKCNPSIRKIIKQLMISTRGSLDGVVEKIKTNYTEFITFENLKNINYQPKGNEGKLILDTYVLDNEILDRKLYDSIVSFLNISNNYEKAAIIHQDWFNLHKRLENKIKDTYIESCDNWVWKSFLPPKSENEMRAIKLLMEDLYT